MAHLLQRLDSCLSQWAVGRSRIQDPNLQVSRGEPVSREDWNINEIGFRKSLYTGNRFHCNYVLSPPKTMGLDFPLNQFWENRF